MTLTLLFGVHAHQPVGNFPEVIEAAHLRCYRMFLQTLERYPEFRFSVHFSGWLLDVLMERHPQDMERLAMMTRRGQVQWFGSGDCEPVLAAIPHRDRVSQLAALSDKIERRFGQRPEGAWLTERVWESSVVPALAGVGMRYAVVDDYHFLCAGQAADRLDSHWSTEEDGQVLDLFPISEQARYRLPFSPAEQAVAWLEQCALDGQRAVIYFDDIEKFGIWPQTWEWVYQQGWLERFVEGVLQSPHVVTGTFAQYHRDHATRGIVYLPSTSYMEMNEWTLPAPAARVLHALLEREKAAGRYPLEKSNLRGGIWRNFLSRYAEVNWMHKRMLGLSARLAALPAHARTARMQTNLHRAQANDAYWHGLFGGLYLPHLRRAIWNHLLALEAELNACAPPPSSETRDADNDGHDETFLRTGALQAVVRDDGHACLIELCSYDVAHNFGDTLRRVDEAYYDKITEGQEPGAAAGSGIASAHDRIAFIDRIEPADLVPDRRGRWSFVDTWIAPDGQRMTLDGYRRGAAPGEYLLEGDGWQMRKRYAVAGARLTVHYQPVEMVGRLEVELNVAMPSCGGYAGRYILADGSMPCGFGQPLDLVGATTLVLDDGILGGALRLTCAPAAIAAQPHYTVSQSEGGFERIMQAVELRIDLPLAHDGAGMTIELACLPHRESA